LVAAQKTLESELAAAKAAGATAPTLPTTPVVPASYKKSV
jgi:hypothetical protein